MARVRFSRGVRANIDKINTNKTATEGSLYFATDDGTLWYGTASGTLTQVRDNIDHNTTYTSLKNPYSLTLQGNGTTLTNGTYDGSSAKTVNITPASIGASASGHKHSASDITTGTLSVARGGTGQTNLDNVTVGTAKSIINTGGRITSANQSHGDGKLYYYLATSAMTEGKPNEDGHIIHLSWDNKDGWDSQISQDNTNGGLEVRGQDNGTWSAWARVYDENHKPSASDVTGLGNLATKSTNGSTANFLRGDGTWATPSYPSVSNATITIKQTGKTDQTFTLNGGNATISLNDNNTWTAFKGATTSAAGTAGYAPAPTAGAANRYLRSDGTWAVPPNDNTHKTWGLSISGHTVSIVDGGTTKSVTVPDNDHTYTLASLGGITPSEVDSKISTAVASAYKYKGSCTSDKLPTTGQVTGDVWNITNDSTYGKAGMNVAWNGTAWDALGSNVDLSNYALKSSIPSVSNATITIKQTGKADQTFTLNGGATTISLNDNNTTYSSLKNPYSLTIQGNGTTLANGTYDGSSAKTVNITPSSIGAAPSDVVVVSSTQPDASTCKLWIKA